MTIFVTIPLFMYCILKNKISLKTQKIFSYNSFFLHDRNKKSANTIEKYLRDIRAFAVYIKEEVVTKDVAM